MGIEATTSPKTCYRHTDRETYRSCSRCGVNACSECLTNAPVGAHCRECVANGSQAAVQARIRPAVSRSATAVTLAIIGINVLVALWVLGQSPGNGISGRSSGQVDLGLFGPFVADGEWYRLVTSGFTHAGILHLAFNMIVIWQFGTMLEPALGKARFIGLYIAALLAGSAGALLLSPDALTVGASGAAFGLVGAAAVGFQRRGESIWSTGIGMMLVINLVVTFAVPGISVGGHLGGLAGGALVGAVYFWDRRGPAKLVVSLGAAVVVSAFAFGLALVAASA